MDSIATPPTLLLYDVVININLLCLSAWGFLIPSEIQAPCSGLVSEASYWHANTKVGNLLGSQFQTNLFQAQFLTSTFWLPFLLFEFNM